MSVWVDHLTSNYTAKQLIDVLEANGFGNAITMKLLDCTGDEAAEISEINLEEMIIEAIEILLKGTQITYNMIMELCDTYKTYTNKLIDSGIIIEWKNKYYEGE